MLVEPQRSLEKLWDNNGKAPSGQVRTISHPRGHWNLVLSFYSKPHCGDTFPPKKTHQRNEPLLIRARKSNIQLQQQQQQQKSQPENTPSTCFPSFGPPFLSPSFWRHQEKSVLFSSGDMLLTCTLSDCNDHRSLLCQGGIHMCQHVLQNQWLLATYKKTQPEQKASKRERFQGITVEFYDLQMGRFNGLLLMIFVDSLHVTKALPSASTVS